MSATSDQRSHHHSAHQVAIASHRDKGTIRLGEGEPAVQSRGAGDNMDAGMVIPAGLKRSVTRPRQRVRRRVEKPQVQTGGARRQHQVTNPSSQGKANHDMRTSTPVTMPPRNNENVPTAMTGPGAEAKLAAATASIASTTRRETVTQEPVTTAVGNTTESRDEISARICEIGYRSVLNAEEASITAWRPLPQVCSRQFACANCTRIAHQTCCWHVTSPQRQHAHHRRQASQPPSQARSHDAQSSEISPPSDQKVLTDSHGTQYAT